MQCLIKTLNIHVCKFRDQLTSPVSVIPKRKMLSRLLNYELKIVTKSMFRVERIFIKPGWMTTWKICIDFVHMLPTRCCSHVFHFAPKQSAFATLSYASDCVTEAFIHEIFKIIISCPKLNEKNIWRNNKMKCIQRLEQTTSVFFMFKHNLYLLARRCQ